MSESELKELEELLTHSPADLTGTLRFPKLKRLHELATKAAEVLRQFSDDDPYRP